MGCVFFVLGKTSFYSKAKHVCAALHLWEAILKEKDKRVALWEAAKAVNDGHCYPKQICEYCGTEYWPVRPSQKYCCKNCGNAALESKRLGRDVADKEGHAFFKRTCIECGKEFWPESASAICCSDECVKQRISKLSKEKYNQIREIRLAENEGHLFPKAICGYCGEEFWPTQNKQRFCSQQCYHDSVIRDRNDGKMVDEKEGHPFFQTNCIVCGKPFWPAGPNTKICSDDCRKIRYKQQKNEFIERQKAKEQTAEIISIAPSLPEKEYIYAQG